VSDRPLADRLLARDPRAIARAISLIESEGAEGAALLGRIYPHSGRAYLVGMTGPPGAGKSTLVDRMTAEWRKDGVTVGVLAVDPTSPYTGGAILGDRVRMQAHAEDAGVFIRSMATRGHLGGLARTTGEAAIVLDAAGYDIVIIETVGVGQDEVDIVRTADVAVVTLVPGSGDDVQALKAGIMEIADIFVVNKADREGAERTAASIESMLSLGKPPAGTWRPPVLRTEATTGRGVRELVERIGQFRQQADPTLGVRRRARAEWRLREILGRRLMRYVEDEVLGPGEFGQLLNRVVDRSVDPYRAVETVMARAVGVKAVRAAPTAVSVDHVGIAVKDVSDLIAFFQGVLGIGAESPVDVDAQQVRVRFLDTGETKLELVEAMSAASPVARFLDRRGPGLHHVALRVPDIRAALATLAARGVRLVDDTPRVGAHGSLIAFVHPASTGAVLVELVERPARP
jgi:LAO/AO transport system kinase